MNLSKEDGGLKTDEKYVKMARDTTEHEVRLTRVGLESLLNPDGDDTVIEDLMLEDLGRKVASLASNEPVDPDLQDCEDKTMSLDQELKCFATARSILEKHGELNDEAQNAFFSCQRTLRPEKVSSLKQTTNLDYF